MEDLMDQLEYAEHETIGQIKSISELMLNNRGYPLTKTEVKDSFDKKLIKKLVESDLIKESLFKSVNSYGGRSGLRSCFVLSELGDRYCKKFFSTQVVF